jgi:hypothetical protein
MFIETALISLFLTHRVKCSSISLDVKLIGGNPVAIVVSPLCGEDTLPFLERFLWDWDNSIGPVKALVPVDSRIVANRNPSTSGLSDIWGGWPVALRPACRRRL